MKSLRARAFLSCTFAIFVVAACGGRIDSVNGASDDSDSGSGASSGGSVSGGGGTSGGGGSIRDAGRLFDASTKSDASLDVCIDVSTSSFDTSCATDDDCIDVTTGHLCSANTCWCGGSAISASEEKHYDDTVAPVVGGNVACPCPFLGRARCVETQCVFCGAFDEGSNPAGCPDGG